MIVAVTGHRKLNLNKQALEKLRREINRLLVKALKKDSDITILCGMAIGADIECAQIVLNLQKKYPSIILKAIIPCKDQSQYWCAIMRYIYVKLLEQIPDEDITYMQDSYTPGCMARRNQYLIEHCEYLLAIYDESKTYGGTFETILYAQKQNKKIIMLNPHSLQVRLNYKK